MDEIYSHTRARYRVRVFRARASLSLVVARDATPISSSGFLHGEFRVHGFVVRRAERPSSLLEHGHRVLKHLVRLEQAHALERAERRSRLRPRDVSHAFQPSPRQRVRQRRVHDHHPPSGRTLGHHASKNPSMRCAAPRSIHSRSNSVPARASAADPDRSVRLVHAKSVRHAQRLRHALDGVRGGVLVRHVIDAV